MLASNGMRLARELRSPLAPALALVAASLFLAHDPGTGSLPWLGLAALVLVGWLFATQAAPDGCVRLRAFRRASPLWCALSIAWSIEPDRTWSYANRTFVYLAFALVGAHLGTGPRAGCSTGSPGSSGPSLSGRSRGRSLPWLHEGYGRSPA